MTTKTEERVLKYPGTITLTLGDAGENHVGMEMKGQLGEPGSGFTPDELEKAALQLYQLGRQVEFHWLTSEETDPAAILIIRNYLDVPIATEMLTQLMERSWDAKYFDRRRGRVLNKLARHNVVIMDGYSQEPDYEQGKGTILDGDTIPTFRQFKQEMTETINLVTQSDKASQLVCEGNLYYNVLKTGIGFHGDAERRKVVAGNFCDEGIIRELNYIAYLKSERIGKRFRMKLKNGDMYIMIGAAAGTDWKKRNKITFRHAAGVEGSKFLK